MSPRIINESNQRTHTSFYPRVCIGEDANLPNLGIDKLHTCFNNDSRIAILPYLQVASLANQFNVMEFNAALSPAGAACNAIATVVIYNYLQGIVPCRSKDIIDLLLQGLIYKCHSSLGEEVLPKGLLSKREQLMKELYQMWRRSPTLLNDIFNNPTEWNDLQGVFNNLITPITYFVEKPDSQSAGVADVRAAMNFTLNRIDELQKGLKSLAALIREEERIGATLTTHAGYSYAVGLWKSALGEIAEVIFFDSHGALDTSGGRTGAYLCTWKLENNVNLLEIVANHIGLLIVAGYGPHKNTKASGREQAREQQIRLVPFKMKSNTNMAEMGASGSSST